MRKTCPWWQTSIPTKALFHATSNSKVCQSRPRNSPHFKIIGDKYMERQSVVSSLQRIDWREKTHAKSGLPFFDPQPRKWAEYRGFVAEWSETSEGAPQNRANRNDSSSTAEAELHGSTAESSKTKWTELHDCVAEISEAKQAPRPHHRIEQSEVSWTQRLRRRNERNKVRWAPQNETKQS